MGHFKVIQQKQRVTELNCHNNVDSLLSMKEAEVTTLEMIYLIQED
jgi:hypothetical protein